MSVLEKLTSTWATESKVRLMYEHTTTSTFESAKHNFLIDQDTSVTLYTAGQQTEGRGRGERTVERNCRAPSTRACSRFHLRLLRKGAQEVSSNRSPWRCSAREVASV